MIVEPQAGRIGGRGGQIQHGCQFQKSAVEGRNISPIVLQVTELRADFLHGMMAPNWVRKAAVNASQVHWPNWLAAILVSEMKHDALPIRVTNQRVVQVGP